jgi:hypothetical protein
MTLSGMLLADLSIVNATLQHFASLDLSWASWGASAPQLFV